MSLSSRDGQGGGESQLRRFQKFDLHQLTPTNIPGRNFSSHATLDQRYLWIDSLGIIRDDLENRGR